MRTFVKLNLPIIWYWQCFAVLYDSLGHEGNPPNTEMLIAIRFVDSDTSDFLLSFSYFVFQHTQKPTF